VQVWGLTPSSWSALAHGLAAGSHQDAPGVEPDVVGEARHALEVDGHMEARALAGSAFHVDGAAHGVHDELGDGEAKTHALGAVHATAVLALEGGEELLLVLLRHAHAGVLHRKVGAHPALAPEGGLLPEMDVDAAAGGGELHGVAEEVEEHLVEAHAVAEDMLGEYAGNPDVEFLPVGHELGTDDVAQALDGIPQGEVLHLQRHLAALDLGHVENVVDEAEQLLAGDHDPTMKIPDGVAVERAQQSAWRADSQAKICCCNANQAIIMAYGN